MDFEIVDTSEIVELRAPLWQTIGNAALANRGKSIKVPSANVAKDQDKASANLYILFGKGRFLVNSGDGCIYVTAKESI